MAKAKKAKIKAVKKKAAKKQTVKKQVAKKKIATKKIAKKKTPVKKNAGQKNTTKKTVSKTMKKMADVKNTNAKLKPILQNKAKKNEVALKKVDYSKAITPLADRLVVRVSAAEKVTSGGIIIPQTSAVSGHIRGTVLAVGHGATSKKGHTRPLDVQKGDEILFSEFAGTKVVFNSEELLIIQESDVLGVVQG